MFTLLPKSSTQNTVACQMVLSHPNPSWKRKYRGHHPEVKRIKPTNPEALVATWTTWHSHKQLRVTGKHVQRFFESRLFYLVLWTPACGCTVRWKDRNRDETAQQAIHLKGNLCKCRGFAVHVCHVSFASTFVDVVPGVSEESAVRLCEWGSQDAGVHGDIPWLTILTIIYLMT